VAFPGRPASATRQRHWYSVKTAGNRQNVQNVHVDALRPFWQDGVALVESENRFSFTRAASSKSAHEKAILQSAWLSLGLVAADEPPV
jgi:hypothetical protein